MRRGISNILRDERSKKFNELYRVQVLRCCLKQLNLKPNQEPETALKSHDEDAFE